MGRDDPKDDHEWGCPTCKLWGPTQLKKKPGWTVACSECGRWTYPNLGVNIPAGDYYGGPNRFQRTHKQQCKDINTLRLLIEIREGTDRLNLERICILVGPDTLVIIVKRKLDNLFRRGFISVELEYCGRLWYHITPMGRKYISDNLTPDKNELVKWAGESNRRKVHVLHQEGFMKLMSGEYSDPAIFNWKRFIWEELFDNPGRVWTPEQRNEA